MLCQPIYLSIYLCIFLYICLSLFIYSGEDQPRVCARGEHGADDRDGPLRRDRPRGRQGARTGESSQYIHVGAGLFVCVCLMEQTDEYLPLGDNGHVFRIQYFNVLTHKNTIIISLSCPRFSYWEKIVADF